MPTGCSGGFTNTLKHAGPARAQVVVSYGNTDITISVRDTGQGHEDSINRPGSGFGLELMRERAALYGGTVERAATPAEATPCGLRCRFPEGSVGDGSGLRR